MLPSRPICKVGRRDVCAVLFWVDRALRRAGLNRQADEFLKRANAYWSYDDIARLASEYVELVGVPR